MYYNNIKKIAGQKKITLRELAERIKMSEAGLYYAFRNDSLKVKDLEKIAEILDVPFDKFFEKGNIDVNQYGKNSNIIRTNEGSINYNIAGKKNKDTASEAEMMNQHYWTLIQNVMEEMTDVFVKIAERDPDMIDYLKEQREMQKFISQLNTMLTMTEGDFFYNKDFFKFFKNPYTDKWNK